MNKKLTPVHYFIMIGVIVFGGLIAFAVYQGLAPSPYDAFAQCLTEKKAKMWGTWWCPNCENQKKLFGKAFDSIDYRECSSPGQKNQLAVCKEAGITSYPTWEFSDGARITGTTPLEDLAEKTGCALPTSP